MPATDARAWRKCHKINTLRRTLAGAALGERGVSLLWVLKSGNVG